MKIKSPLSSKRETALLCQAGADELFCGIEPQSWRKAYRGLCINQRAKEVNFNSLKNLEDAIFIAHKHEVKVHVAVNGFFNSDNQFKLALGVIKDALESGADGIIFGDPALILNSRSGLLRGKDIIAGTDAVVFNGAAVKFYKNLGVNRVVLPRSMTLKEIEEVVNLENSMEYEAFIINDLCFFEDGFCTFCKDQSQGANQKNSGINDLVFFSAAEYSPRIDCRAAFDKQRIMLRGRAKPGKIKTFRFWMKKHIQGCGACSLYRFKNIGVDALKVLDRNLPTEEKVKSTRFIKECADLLTNNISRGEYVKKCKALFKQTFKVHCSRYDCYYPSFFQDGKSDTFHKP